MPDNGDVPSDNRALQQCDPVFCWPLDRRLHSSALGHDTVGYVPPERDQELACERHDHNLAKAPSCLADAFAKPDYLRRTWLVALPEPSQLHHHRSEPSIAGFPYALWRSSPPLLYGVAVSPAYAPSALPLANRRTKASRTSTVALCTPIPRKPASC